MSTQPPQLRVRLHAAVSAFRTPSILNKPPSPSPVPHSIAATQPSPAPLLIPPLSTSELAHIIRRRLYTLTLPDTPHLILAEHLRHFLTVTFSLLAALHVLQTDFITNIRPKRPFRISRIISLLQLPPTRTLFFPFFRHIPPLLWLLEPFRFLSVPFAIDGVVRFGVEQVRKRLPPARVKTEFEEFVEHVQNAMDSVGEKVEEVVGGVKRGVEEAVEGVVKNVQRDVEMVKEGMERFIEGKGPAGQKMIEDADKSVKHENREVRGLFARRHGKQEMKDTQDERKVGSTESNPEKGEETTEKGEELVENGTVLEVDEQRVRTIKEEWEPLRGKGLGDLISQKQRKGS